MADESKTEQQIFTEAALEVAHKASGLPDSLKTQTAARLDWLADNDPAFAAAISSRRIDPDGTDKILANAGKEFGSIMEQAGVRRSNTSDFDPAKAMRMNDSQFADYVEACTGKRPSGGGWW